MSKRGRPPKTGSPRYPGGELKPERMEPTKEMLKRRKELTGYESVGIDHPLDILHAKGLLSRADEDRQEADRRRDAGAAFANLAHHVWGQPFASIDARTRRMVKPSINTDDADAMAEKEARARQTDLRSPEERAEAVRLRFEAMLSLIRRGSIREYVLKQVAVYCTPINQLARNPSKREQLRRHLLDALDLIADERAVRRAQDGVRGEWTRRAA